MTKPSSRTRALNARQERFAYALALQVIRGQPESPTEAAREAGYKDSSALRKTACKMAQDPRVRAIVDPAVDRAAKQLAEEFSVKKDDILKELALMGFARLNDAVEWGQQGYFVRDPSEITERGHAALSSIEITEDRIGEDIIRRKTKVRLHKKTEALLAAARLSGHLHEDKTPNAMAGVQIIINGGPTGLEVQARKVEAVQPTPKRSLPKRSVVTVGA